MSIEKCGRCGDYHAADGRECSPVSAAQPWGGRSRPVGQCDRCGDPTTATAPDGETRCPACQRKAK